MPDGSKSRGEDWIAIVRKNASPEFRLQRDRDGYAWESVSYSPDWVTR